MARAQTRFAMDALSRRGFDCEEVLLNTAGDMDQRSKLSTIGGKGGAFIASIRQAMRDGSIDIAMHSLKDIPGNEEYDRISEEFGIGAFLPRDDARDCLVYRADLAADELRAGAVFATTSVRRAAFIRRLYPRCSIVNSRGAADSRIRKLDQRTGQKLTYSHLDAEAVERPADALVLAKSGLQRIGFHSRVGRVFSIDEMCPALGQGVVVLEYRRDRSDLRAVLSSVNDDRTAIACRAERSMLKALNGHCNSPIAGFCALEHGELRLRGVVLSCDGSEFIESNLTTMSDAPERLGESVARRLMRNGAARLIEESRFL